MEHKEDMVCGERVHFDSRHGWPRDLVRPLCNEWLWSATKSLFPIVQVDCPGIAEENLRNRVQTVTDYIFASEVPDKRATQRKKRSDAGKKRKQETEGVRIIDRIPSLPDISPVVRNLPQ